MRLPREVCFDLSKKKAAERSDGAPKTSVIRKYPPVESLSQRPSSRLSKVKTLRVNSNQQRGI
jgi:hypothetical protein